MGRPAKYDADLILDAAAALVAERGPGAATATAIARRAGAPSGSVYHRFGSRDLLLAHLWVRAVRRFQEGYLRALAGPDVERAADDAVAYVPAWCRANRDDAGVLLLHRRDELTSTWPDKLGDARARADAALEDALREFAGRRFGAVSPETVERSRFALVDVPYAGVRRALAAGAPPPAGNDGLIVAAARAVLDHPWEQAH